MNEPLIPEFEEGKSNNLYQYDYSFKFDDKVYYTKANLDLTKQLLRKWDVIRKNNTPENSKLAELAGDLKEEYFYYLDMNIQIGYIESFITIHLEKIYNKKIGEITFSNSKELNKNVSSIWVNYQSQYEHNPVHNHTGLLSFVWYLDIPEEIRQESENQKSNKKSRGMIEFSSKMSTDVLLFNPKTADVFVFDSKHPHQVYPFYTDNTRVSMAGNIYSITFEDGETITA